jgi:hypothetical protein
MPPTGNVQTIRPRFVFSRIFPRVFCAGVCAFAKRGQVCFEVRFLAVGTEAHQIFEGLSHQSRIGRKCAANLQRQDVQNVAGETKACLRNGMRQPGEGEPRPLPRPSNGASDLVPPEQAIGDNEVDPENWTGS